MPRESLINRIRPFVLIFLLVVLPIALFHTFTDYMYVYRIPAGTKVVGTSTIPQRSRLGEYIYGSVLIKKWHWDWLIPYLDYRHCIIPEGADVPFAASFEGKMFVRLNAPPVFVRLNATPPILTVAFTFTIDTCAFFKTFSIKKT